MTFAAAVVAAVSLICGGDAATVGCQHRPVWRGMVNKWLQKLGWRRHTCASHKVRVSTKMFLSFFFFVTQK